MNAKLTPSEKELVARYRARPPRRAARWMVHGVYVFPSFLFAILGLVRADYVALLVAWGVLLGYAIYLQHVAYAEQDQLRGVLRKLGAGAGRSGR